MCPGRGTKKCPGVQKCAPVGAQKCAPGYKNVPRLGHKKVPRPGHIKVPYPGHNSGAHLCAPVGAPLITSEERKMEREQEDALQTDDLLQTMAW